MTTIALSPVQAGARAFSGAMKAATRHVRWTVLISILLIFGSFVSAAVIQMRRDRAHALSQAALMETRRADEIAADLSATLDRYAALGAAFANAEVSAETSAALSEAGGPVLRNIAVLDGAGQLLFEMKKPPRDLLPLDRTTLGQATAGRAVFSADGGRSLVLAFPQGGQIVLVQLAGHELFPRASMENDLIATRSGRALLLGRSWRELPPSDSLALHDSKPAVRILRFPSGRRLVALTPLARWPVIAGASVQVGEALSGWYGALPLYFFFILGPAFAGAGLAVVFVRELERRTRPTSAGRLLKAKRNEEAKLLIRLADAERRAVEAARSKAEFIAHMSHELRTPLNAIIGFSEVIEQGMFGAAGSPKYTEYAHDIGTAGRQLHARIDDILAFAQVESGGQPVRLEKVDAADSAREAVAQAAGFAFSRHIEISEALPHSAMAVADARALKRALNNLLHNALQYTKDGGAVQVQLREDAATVILTVQDSGPGFSTAEAGRATEPFTRFDRPGSATGTGLGLAIASSLIRRMGGTLTVSAHPEKGAVAEIRLRRS